MEYRILGNQPELTLTQPGMYISDFELRHKSIATWRKGVALVNEFCSEHPEFEGTQFFINDPLTVGIYPQYEEGETPYDFDELVLKLESMGFYGKGAGYSTLQSSFEF